MKIYCCECKKEVEAMLLTGKEVYPHRKDLYKKKIYKCPTCGNYVGCHRESTRPLGYIPNKQIKEMRIAIHELLDPIWKSKKISRKELYSRISKELGYTYHTGQTKTVEECIRVQNIVQEIRKELK